MCAWTAALSVCAIVLAESDGPWRVVAIAAAAIITAYAIGKLHLLEPVLRHHYVPRKKPRAKEAQQPRFNPDERIPYQDLRRDRHDERR